MEKKLNKKYQAVADEYMINGFRAGPAYSTVYKTCSPETAETEGPRVIRLPQVQAYIESIQAENRKKYEVTKEELIEVTKRIMLTQEKVYAPASLKAVEILAKLFGYNAAEKHDVNLNTEQPLFGPDKE